MPLLSAKLPSVLAVTARNEGRHRFIGRPGLLLGVRSLRRLATSALEHPLGRIEKQDMAASGTTKPRRDSSDGELTGQQIY